MASTALTELEIQRAKRMLNAGMDVIIDALEGNREIDGQVKLATQTNNTAAKLLSTENARQALGVQMLLRFADSEQIKQVMEYSLPELGLALAGQGEKSRVLDAEPKPPRQRKLSQKTGNTPDSK